MTFWAAAKKTKQSAHIIKITQDCQTHHTPITPNVVGLHLELLRHITFGVAFYLKKSHTYTHKRHCGLTYGYFQNVVAFYLKESSTYTHKRPCGLTCGYYPNVVAFYLKE
jgi:hypothetical protein